MSLFDYACLAALLYFAALALVLHLRAAKAKQMALESEEKFLQLFEEVPLGCQETGMDGVIRRVNQKLCDLRGLPESAILGKHYADFVAESDRERVREETRQKLTGERPLEPGKQTYIREDGESITIQVHEALLRDKLGAIVGLRSAALDVTEHIRKEEEIWQTTGELKAIFQALPDLFLRLDTAGSILDYRGPIPSNFLGPGQEFLGKRFQDLVPPEVGRQVEKAIERVRQNSSMVAIEFCLSPKDEVFFEARLIPLHWKEIIVIMRDISERKRTEKRLQEYAEEVQEKNSDLGSALATAREATLMKGRFLANMSHEIRTPMNGVLGMTDLLLDTALSPEQREYAEAVKQSAGVLLTITNDILDLSKIEAGRLTIESVPFDLIDTVRQITAWFAVRARAKGLDLNSILPSESALPVRGDPVRVRQILTNLVGNAIKFTETGSVTVRVEIAGKAPEPLKVRFSVEDTGIGIPLEQRDRLFQIFTQGDSSTTRKYGGTGLGLAISKQLVELLGGDIGVDSERGRGSKFWFTLMFEKQIEAPLETAPLLALSGSLDGMQVLLVESAISRPEELRASLQSWGCVIEEMSAAAWIIPQLRFAAQSGNPFHLVLLDLDIPCLDSSIGADILADPLVFNTALIAMISSVSPPDDAKLRERGFTAFLPKPVVAEQLHRTLLGIWKAAAAPVAAPDEQPEEQPRVLLAEDNLVNQKIVLRLLEKAGLKADVVANGSQAVAATSQTAYDLILMDCQMPEMDGFEATAEIRRLEGNVRHTTICALTAHAMAGDRERCLDAGMDDYISKPLTIGVLNNKIAHWIHSKQRNPNSSAPVAQTV